MHDEQEPLHDPPREPLSEPARESAPDARRVPLRNMRSGPLPPALRNWQVLEIDSQATPLPEPAAELDTKLDPEPSAELDAEFTVEVAPASSPEVAAVPAASPSTARPEDLRDLQIGDRTDEILVAALDNRRRTVECGATVEYAVSLLNNSPQPATFQVQIEGWIDPQWLGDASGSGTAVAVTLEPGRRATLRLPLSPPRRAASEAGDYHFAVAVRSPQYPARQARLGALLTVLPFDVAEMRFLERGETVVSWLHRSATLPLMVANRGNHPATFTLHAVTPTEDDVPLRCRFGAADNDAGLPSLTLGPDQAITLPVRVEVLRPPLIGLHGRDLPVQVEARRQEQPAAGARTQLVARPLVGPWQIVAAMGVAAAGAVGLLLVLALVFLLAQRSAVQQAPLAAAPVAVAAVPPPVIIVTLNQPAGSPVIGSAAGAALGGPSAASSFTAGASPDPALPLVLPDQVSAPSGAGAGVAPAVAAASAGGAPSALPLAADEAAPSAAAGSSGGSSASQTYGQMFQDVGSRFDLDWRLLAAQAYVESGFDSLALSDSGAMGLMQVLPNTWREWAPAVEASDPFDAYSSVLVAAAYLDYLRGRLAGQGYPETEWMLVAYNWGPDQLNDFLADGGGWDSLPEVRRQYAREILRIAKSIP
jgi:soluble lytic murein transglycosylase-like protein